MTIAIAGPVVCSITTVPVRIRSAIVVTERVVANESTVTTGHCTCVRVSSSSTTEHENYVTACTVVKTDSVRTAVITFRYKSTPRTCERRTCHTISCIECGHHRCRRTVTPHVTVSTTDIIGSVRTPSWSKVSVIVKSIACLRACVVTTYVPRIVNSTYTAITRSDTVRIQKFEVTEVHTAR